MMTMMINDFLFIPSKYYYYYKINKLLNFFVSNKNNTNDLYKINKSFLVSYFYQLFLQLENLSDFSLITLKLQLST